MKQFKLIILITGFILISNIIVAQNKEKKPIKDTIISVFNPSDAHKDGYRIGGNTIVDLPTRVVQKCAYKKIRIIGKKYNHVVTEDDLKYKNEDGDTVYMQGRVGTYSTFVINNISVWDAKKHTWRLVYINKKEE